jgi:hypothetical protein
VLGLYRWSSGGHGLAVWYPFLLFTKYVNTSVKNVNESTS